MINSILFEWRDESFLIINIPLQWLHLIGHISERVGDWYLLRSVSDSHFIASECRNNSRFAGAVICITVQTNAILGIANATLIGWPWFVFISLVWSLTCCRCNVIDLEQQFVIHVRSIRIIIYSESNGNDGICLCDSLLIVIFRENNFGLLSSCGVIQTKRSLFFKRIFKFLTLTMFCIIGLSSLKFGL